MSEKTCANCKCCSLNYGGSPWDDGSVSCLNMSQEFKQVWPDSCCPLWRSKEAS